MYAVFYPHIQGSHSPGKPENPGNVRESKKLPKSQGIVREFGKFWRKPGKVREIFDRLGVHGRPAYREKFQGGKISKKIGKIF